MTFPSDGTLSVSGMQIIVAGLGVSGAAVARVLAARGARVLAVDAGARTPVWDELESLGVRIDTGFAAWTALPAGLWEQAPDRPMDLVVTSPGWRPQTPLFALAQAAGVPVWGEVELAWRLRAESGITPAPWLAVTGTNGKTTTVQLLEAMLRAGGHRAVAAGNVGTPLIESVLAREPDGSASYDVIAVELSSFQLHWTASLAVHSAAVLNIAPDHLDWHGSLAAYADAKGKVLHGVTHACVYNVADPATRELVERADVTEGARAIGFTLGIPALAQLGIVENYLCDRAFLESRHTSAIELAELEDLSPELRSGPGGLPSPHVVANALAAAALARAYGVEPTAIREALRTFAPGAHRGDVVRVLDDVSYVDDSKATNAHAASAALGGQRDGTVVWIAGGLAKGATFDELIERRAPKLKAVVVIGVDRAPMVEALRRHAPAIPVLEITAGDTGAVNMSPEIVMSAAVRAARDVATAGDVVLLAPACASMDQFDSYAQRGEIFAQSVRELISAVAG